MHIKTQSPSNKTQSPGKKTQSPHVPMQSQSPQIRRVINDVELQCVYENSEFQSQSPL